MTQDVTQAVEVDAPRVGIIMGSKSDMETSSLSRRAYSAAPSSPKNMSSAVRIDAGESEYAAVISQHVCRR